MSAVTAALPETLTGTSMYAALRDQTRWNLPAEELSREAVAAGEAALTRDGALAVMTGTYTGRSPRDKFTVRRSLSAERIDWSSRFNQPYDPVEAETLAARFLEHARRRPRLYGFRGFIGRGPRRVPVALISELAWHSLMGRHMYVRPTPQELQSHQPEFTLLYLPSFLCRPERDHTHSEAIVLCDLERRLGLIGGTQYGGEEKKFFFYLMNYLLPCSGDFPMHCSANAGPRGEVNLIFGLSGTGKTTLSMDPARRLIGDDEHGWDEDGVFNFEGGCYAKLVRLSKEREPLIWGAVHCPGSILENVALRNGEPDFQDPRIENTRGVYPLDALAHIEPSGAAGHPTTIAFLTFDASGTLPPISLLDEDQALYWFLAGYTAKVAGTERGLTGKPEPTFSACFAAPFLPWHPRKYVELFRAHLRRTRPLVVLMNTGAICGPFGAGGRRPPLEATRAMLDAAQRGSLREVATWTLPQLGLRVPLECPGVDARLLDPRTVWEGGQGAYDAALTGLVDAFHANVNQPYAGAIDRAILDAGPRRL